MSDDAPAFILPYSGPGGPLYDDGRFPGQHLPPRAEQRIMPLSAFGRLAKGQPLGKSTILLYDQATSKENNPPDLFQVRGADIDACQMSITLCSPEVAPTGLTEIPVNPRYNVEDLQNIGGTQNNYQAGTRVIPGTGRPCQWPPIVARVQWGCDGAVAEAEVDFVNGTVVNVYGSIVNVNVYVPYDALAFYTGSSGPYKLKGFLSPGWSRPGNAQRTVYVGDLSLADGLISDVLPIPPFAKSATVIGSDPTTPPVTTPPALTLAYLSFFADAGGRYQVGTYLVNGNQPLPFRIPNGAQYFTVTGGSDTATRYATLFDLAI